jgi:Zn2+/Cd2+-exporting ATPase
MIPTGLHMQQQIDRRSATLPLDEDHEEHDPAVFEQEEETFFQRYLLLGATALTGVALLLGWSLARLDVIGSNAEIAFYVLAYIAGGAYAARESVIALWNRSIEIDLLMVTAALGAAIIGHWVEGGILLFLFSLGNALEHYALGRTTRAVRALMELSPDEALVLRDGQEERVPVGKLQIGDTIVVKPGERIAADGDVMSGSSAIDQSPITGESMPVGKEPGEPVFAGTINGLGALEVRVSRLAHESTLAKIIKVVQEAQSQKSATQRFTDRFEGRYAFGVIAGSALYLALLTFLGGFEFSDAFYRSMILLVVASPCALVISTPASTLSGLANGARQGVLIKGALYLETLGTVNVVAFDKTGTLTIGKPKVTDVLPLQSVSKEDVLRLAASAERTSEHPLAQAVVNAAVEQGLELQDSSDLQAITGQGIRAQVEHETVLIGNDKLFEAHGLRLDAHARSVADGLRDSGKTTMYVGVTHGDNEVRILGVIGIADSVRPVARLVIEQLHELGVEKTILLTGDNERSAAAIAQQTGITDYRAGLLPEDKLRIIEDLRREHGSVAMVGDGVNDAPALATADIGVAMGGAGSDVALETSDIVLMADDLTKLPYAVELSRKTRRIIRQNLTFALSVIVILVIGTIVGVTTLPLGVIGHEGSTIIVVANGLRLLRGVSTAVDPPTSITQFAPATD